MTTTGRRSNSRTGGRIRSHGAARAQTTLAGLAVALVLVTAVTVGGVAAADQVLADAAGESLEQHRAESATDTFLTESPITRSDNGSDAIDLTLANETNATVLTAAIPPLRDAAFRVRIDGRTVAERGNPSSGYMASRGAVGVNRQTVRRSINLSAEPSATLTGRTNRIRLDVNPAPNTTVQTIWVDDRVAFHQPAGIEGQHVVGVSSRPGHKIRVETTGDEPSGNVDVSAAAFDATVARIEVTVDA